MAKTKSATSYADTILERFAAAQSHAQADLAFYAECVWKIAEGTISETEQAAFDMLMQSADGQYDYAGDLDTAKKIIDWRRSGNCLADSEGFQARLDELQLQADNLAADLEKSKANTARLQIEHNAALASLNKFEARGTQWANLMIERPHLFAS